MGCFQERGLVISSQCKLDYGPIITYFAQMAKAPKNSEAAPGGEGLSFEQALQKLESIVESMEGGELSLESMMSRAEEGIKLAQSCQAKLTEAELKIQQLEQSAAGSMLLKPFKPEDPGTESEI